MCARRWTFESPETIRPPRRCRAATCRSSSSAGSWIGSPPVLVVNQPTWGVDAGAAGRIRQALIDRARAGAAVLVISQDLDEIFEIATRIAVISEGRLSAPEPARSMTRERIGLLMGGIHGERETGMAHAS